jgi:hypothetical protein
MNRYSFLFAAIVAATFVAPGTRTADTSPGPNQRSGNAALVAGANKTSEQAASNYGVDPSGYLTTFFTNIVGPAKNPSVLFAAVPHPTETHLAADFDEYVAALQQGIQDSGYLFDSAWIPWEVPRSYDRFKDDETEKEATDYQDKYPGILLFRKPPKSASSSPAPDPYGQGLVVFLISEKPTEGLKVSQVITALDILGKQNIKLASTIRFEGPNYTGSSSSLSPILAALHKSYPDSNFLIRSGGVTGSSGFLEQIAQSASEMPQVHIDFGSAHHDFSRWTGLVREKLSDMGIAPENVASLSEEESSYGQNGVIQDWKKLRSEKSKNEDQREAEEQYSAGMWHISYPRDISSLRAGYEKQGIFDGSSSTPPWKHTLNLQSDAQSEGDTVPSFGSDATVANQESVLLGISEFLKEHRIHAVIISATNPEDSYFLSEFFHANNRGVRIVTVGMTRLFLRGATAQFRGDLVVDDFPMLPRLYDWTAGNPQLQQHWSYTQHIFSTGFAQGVYMAAVDLLAPPDFEGKQFRVYPEYASPDWGDKRPLQIPPMYLTSLSSDAPWPMAMHQDPPISKGSLDSCPYKPSTYSPANANSGSWRVDMPFLLFGHDCGHVFPFAPRGIHPGITSFWTLLLLFLWLVILAYCVCFFYADPLNRRLCASFQPIADGRYWAFTVTIPAILAGCAFQVLAAPMNIPAKISFSISLGWWAAIISSVVAPLLISLSAWIKASRANDSIHYMGKWIAVVLPALLSLIFAWVHLWDFCGRPVASDIGSILNSYREMHWESGLSLIPTWLLVLFALFLWTRQASLSTVLFHISPVLPTFPNDPRISEGCAACMDEIGQPMPDLSAAKWLWICCLGGVAAMGAVVRYLPSFRAVTTLENYAATRCLLYAATVIASLMLLDICQFLWLWNELRKLLRALNTRAFKRSFVPIPDFKWAGFWSFSGVSFYDQRVILADMADCIEELRRAPFGPRIVKWANAMANLRKQYRTVPLQVPIVQYRTDLAGAFDIIAGVASEVAAQMEQGDYREPRSLSFDDELALRNKCCSSDKKSRFADESEQVARLLDWQKTSERLVCLTYIGYIQTAIARLHGLMLSVASVFSLIAVAVAIYPFAPMHPFLLSGLTLFPVLAWAFYHVFSQMDTDPILARITNGDDRKLEWSFYGKFAESLALPVLTLASSLLPGGAGRILEVARTMLIHSQ